MCESYVYDTWITCSYHILWLNHRGISFLPPRVSPVAGHFFLIYLVPILLYLPAGVLPHWAPVLWTALQWTVPDARLQTLQFLTSFF